MSAGFSGKNILLNFAALAGEKIVKLKFLLFQPRVLKFLAYFKTRHLKNPNVSICHEVYFFYKSDVRTLIEGTLPNNALIIAWKYLPL